MVKKIIALILCLSLLPISIVNTYAADDSGLSDTAKEAYDVLSAIGYVNDDYTEDMIADISEFTRSEFVEMAYKIFGNGRKSSEIYYHDVPATHFAAEAIAALVEMNVLSVGSNKMFYPDNPITRTEAAKILLYSLGYDRMCEVRGGWPTGIEKMASDIKLYKNVSSSSAISYADMLIMFYNALTSEILEMQGIKDGEPIYTSNGGTYLSVFHDIYLGNGIVTGVDGVSIYGETVEPEMIYIGNTKLELGGYDADAFLGQEVVYLYSYKNTKNKLIWLKAANDNEVLTLNRYEHSPVFSQSGDTLSYILNNEKTKTVHISSNFNLIFNNSYVTTGVAEILKSDFYEVSLVKSGSSSSYDVVIINDFENYQLVSLPDDSTMYLEACDSNLPKRNIDIDAYERIEIVTAEGAELKPAEIPFDNIISVFESKDKKSIKLVVSSNSVSGVVESVSQMNGCDAYGIHGIEYTPYKEGLNLACRPGDNVVFLLDMTGRIAMLGSAKRSNNFAYLIDAYHNNNGLSDELYVKMYADGDVNEYIVSDNVKIDGIKYKNKELAFDSIGGNDVKPQVVAYELNSEGAVSMLDLPSTIEEATDKTQDNMLVKIEESSKLYDNLSMRLGQKTIMNSNSVIFGVPSNVNTAEDKEYSKVGVSNLEFEQTYTYTSYSYTPEDEFFYSDVLSITRNFNVDYWVSTRFAVNEVTVSINDVGDTIYIAKGYHGSELKEIKLRSSCTPNPQTLHAGDVISVGSRIGDEVIKYTLVYCPHTEPHTHETTNTGYGTGGAFVVVGYVYDVKDKIVKISYTDPAVWGQMVSLQSSKILIYESGSRTKGFREGTPAELLTYKIAGNSCDKVYMYTNSSQMRNFIVFR